MTPIEHHNPMEPHATIAHWDGDKLTVRTATQGISGAQQTLATFFNVPQENVTVISPVTLAADLAARAIPGRR